MGLRRVHGRALFWRGERPGRYRQCTDAFGSQNLRRTFPVLAENGTAFWFSRADCRHAASARARSSWLKGLLSFGRSVSVGVGQELEAPKNS